MPVDLTFWGAAEKKTEVVTNLRKHGFVVQEGASQVVSAGKSLGSSQPQRYGSGSVWSAAVPSRRTFLSPTEVVFVFILICIRSGSALFAVES